MKDKEHKLTDIKLEQMEAKILEIYTQASKEIQETYKKYFEKFAKEDKLKRELYERGEITANEYKEWRKKKLMHGKRFAEMKKNCASQIAHINETAIAYINGELPEIYALNYNKLSTLNNIKGYSFSLLDAYTVKYLATQDASILPKRKLNKNKDVKWNIKSINVQVLQGIIQGESIDKIAKRIIKVQEMNRKAAVRTARTMVTSAENKGRLDSYYKAKENGIELKKEWLATHDERTRLWHRELDGQIKEIEEPFENSIGKIMYPGDGNADGANIYNCRCTLIANLTGFNDKQSINLPNEKLKKPLPVDEIKPKNQSFTKKSKLSQESKTKHTQKEIKTNYTLKQLNNKKRNELEKIGREVARKNAEKNGLTEEAAIYRYDLLISSNTTAQLKKYINRYGK